MNIYIIKETILHSIKLQKMILFLTSITDFIEFQIKSESQKQSSFTNVQEGLLRLFVDLYLQVVHFDKAKV